MNKIFLRAIYYCIMNFFDYFCGMWLSMGQKDTIKTFMDNKTLIDTLARKLNISRETVTALVDGITSVVGECGSGLDSISIAGFGTFEPKKRVERVALHPASGKRLMIPPKIVLSFKPSTALKQKVKKGVANG